jgi:hypothetical protein
MGGPANIVQVLQGLSDYGILSMILIIVAALAGRYLFQYFVSQVSKHLESKEAIAAKVDALYQAALDPQQDKPIRALTVLEQLRALEERCVPDKCPFHIEMRNNTEKTLSTIVEFAKEGRLAREETSRRMVEIFTEYQQVSHALLGLVGKYLEVSGGKGGQSKG